MVSDLIIAKFALIRDGGSRCEAAPQKSGAAIRAHPDEKLGTDLPYYFTIILEGVQNWTQKEYNLKEKHEKFKKSSKFLFFCPFGL